MTAAGQADTASLKRQIRVMLGSSWLVALAVLVVGGGAYARATLQPDLYEGEAVVRVFNATTPGVPGAAGAVRVDPAREVQTQASYMTSDAVRLGVVQRLGPRAGGIGAVRVAGVPNSDLLRVRVESRSPSIAQEAAQAYVDVYVDARKASIAESLGGRVNELRAQAAKIQADISALEARLIQLVPPPEISFGRAIVVPDSEEVKSLRSQRGGLADRLTSVNSLAEELEVEAAIRQASLEVVDPADLPQSPARPIPLRDAAIGGAIGLFLGVALALLRERTNDRLRTVDEVEAAAGGVATLALVPLEKALAKPSRERSARGRRSRPSTLITSLDPTSPASESYRTLRAALLFAGDTSARTLLVTSSVNEEGKTTTAANLALTMARSGAHVLLLDADVKRPSVHRRFGLANDKGLTSVLRREAPLSQVLSSVDVPGPGSLDVLVGGPDGWNAAELLVSGLVEPLLEQMERSYQYVVVDSAPVLSGADPLALAHLANGILLVARVGKIGRRDLQMATQRLEQVSGSVLGVVINAVSPGHAGYYHYYQAPNGDGRLRRKRRVPAAAIPAREAPVPDAVPALATPEPAAATPEPEAATPEPEAASLEPEAAITEREAAIPESEPATPETETAITEPEAATPEPAIPAPPEAAPPEPVSRPAPLVDPEPADRPEQAPAALVAAARNDGVAETAPGPRPQPAPAQQQAVTIRQVGPSPRPSTARPDERPTVAPAVAPPRPVPRAPRPGSKGASSTSPATSRADSRQPAGSAARALAGRWIGRARAMGGRDERADHSWKGAAARRPKPPRRDRRRTMP